MKFPLLLYVSGKLPDQFKLIGNLAVSLARFLNLKTDSADPCDRYPQLTGEYYPAVEVLHGNQPGSKHSRRQSDKRQNTVNRSLEWTEQESDIHLFPHGLTELSDNLTDQGGIIDLLPFDPSASDSKTASELSQSSPVGHATLRTQHTNTELLKRCKKILVENALIKHKGERQLYMAASFVSWPATPDAGIRQRAPLLLYPALLVRVTDEQRYELRMAGTAPEFNNSLQNYLENRFGQQLPAYENNESLSNYLAKLGKAVNSSATLKIDSHLALGSTSLSHRNEKPETLHLPDVPTNFDIPLAMSITGKKSLDQLTAVLSLIPDFSSLGKIRNGVDSTSTTPADIADLRRFATKLAAEGLDHIEFSKLPSLPDWIGKWTLAMQSASTGHTITSVLGVADMSARELIKLSGVIELIDKAPDGIEHLGHGDLCYSNSSTLLRRAQHQSKLIEEELQALRKHFLLDKIPSKSRLLSLISELGNSLERAPDIVEADYFNARRQLLEFCVNKSNSLDVEHHQQLSQLAKVLRFRELFVNNVDYRSALGPAYKGLRTDWDSLIQISDYSRELSEVLGSEGIAASIISHWQDFRRSYIKDLDVLQKGAEATRRVLGLLGADWQSRTIPELIQQSALIATRVAQWQGEYETVDSHANKTPAMVLSSFSGKSMEDVVVESHADETQLHINEQLKSGEISLEQINDTLNWLEQASSAAALHDLDIDAIVEHLQIA